MESCQESYNNLLQVLHDICIYSNIFYLTSGIIAIAAFKKYYKLFGVYILLIGIVSVIHHSNEDFGFKRNAWSILDIVLANVGCLVGMIVLVYLMSKKRVHRRLAYVTILMGLLSIIFFILSEVESARAEKILGTADSVKSWNGPIFTATNEDGNNKDIYKGRSEQAMYLTYHTIWHILSGLTATIWVISVITRP
tara:strand:+ start:3052 stop:3636 length:585 start_codon:yes stop_codon:yes gene_type:complete